MSGLILARLAVAAVWAHQGLWCKLLGRAPQHRSILETTAQASSSWAGKLLITVGAVECGLAVWVIAGTGGRACAAVQTGLLSSMNAAALWRARHLIPDVAGMLLQNCAFLMLAWIAAGQVRL